MNSPWLSGKESACNARDSGDMSSIPGSERSTGGLNGDPLQYFPGKSHGQRSRAGYTPWGRSVRHSGATKHSTAQL